MPIVNSELSMNNHGKEKPNIIRIALADDHPVVRKALKNELAKEADFQVIGEASDGEKAVKLTKELMPDVLIIDIGMPILNGIEATRQIKVFNPDTVVLVLTVYDDIEHILGILEAGADGYLTKNILVEDIIKSIRSVVAGERVLAPQVFQKVLQYALKHSTKPLHLESGLRLTSRELEILKAIAKGMGNKLIAQELEISIRTVKAHLVDIFCKLQVSSRTEAVIAGLRAGFLKHDDLD
jgi:NarL family two-component system response regulator LiaR